MLLDLSKIEAGKMQLHVETFDIAGMIEEMVTTLKPAIAKNAKRISAPNAGGNRHDGRRRHKGPPNPAKPLEQRLQIYRPRKCVVGCEPRFSPGSGLDSIPFGDTGIGISTETAREPVQEFMQAISRFPASTGNRLGPRISHRFVQLMKGRISVESAPGQGSVFTVHLPVQAAGSRSKLRRPRKRQVRSFL